MFWTSDPALLLVIREHCAMRNAIDWRMKWTVEIMEQSVCGHGAKTLDGALLLGVLVREQYFGLSNGSLGNHM